MIAARLVAALGLFAAGCAASILPPSDYSFAQYVKDFDKTYDSDADRAARETLFYSRLGNVWAHNANPTFTWKEGVNHLTDRTDAELSQLRGWNHKMAKQRDAAAGAKTFQSDEDAVLPDSIDWTTHDPPVVTKVKNQAACGSCWSFATAETLESQWAIKKGQLNVLSEQQILSCPMDSNPQHCGGTGGCEGGIAENAYKGIMKAGGLVLESDYPYVSGGGQDHKCKPDIATIPKAANVTGFVKVTQNSYSDLMQAIATIGPIAISVDAGSWSAYHSGVYDGCSKKNVDLDHAVQLVGYGTTSDGTAYWKVRNSWGESWGEKGYIMLKRNVVAAGAQPECGVDKRPSDGTGCDGNNGTQWVCGTCGILYDNCYPTVE